MKHVAVYLVEAGNLEQIEHIDEVLDEHCQEAGAHELLLLRADIRYTIPEPIDTIMPWKLGLMHFFG